MFQLLPGTCKTMQSCSFALASKATTLKANARGTEQSVFIVTVGHGAHLSNVLETQSGSVLITWSSCSWNKWRKLCDAAWWHVVLALCSDAGCHGGVGGWGGEGATGWNANQMKHGKLQDQLQRGDETTHPSNPNSSPLTHCPSASSTGNWIASHSAKA